MAIEPASIDNPGEIRFSLNILLKES